MPEQEVEEIEALESPEAQEEQVGDEERRPKPKRRAPPKRRAKAPRARRTNPSDKGATARAVEASAKAAARAAGAAAKLARAERDDEEVFEEAALEGTIFEGTEDVVETLGLDRVPCGCPEHVSIRTKQRLRSKMPPDTVTPETVNDVTENIGAGGCYEWRGYKGGRMVRGAYLKLTIPGEPKKTPGAGPNAQGSGLPPGAHMIPDGFEVDYTPAGEMILRRVKKEEPRDFGPDPNVEMYKMQREDDREARLTEERVAASKDKEDSFTKLMGLLQAGHNHMMEIMESKSTATLTAITLNNNAVLAAMQKAGDSQMQAAQKMVEGQQNWMVQQSKMQSEGLAAQQKTFAESMSMAMKTTGEIYKRGAEAAIEAKYSQEGWLSALETMGIPDVVRGLAGVGPQQQPTDTTKELTVTPPPPAKRNVVIAPKWSEQVVFCIRNEKPAAYLADVALRAKLINKDAYDFFCELATRPDPAEQLKILGQTIGRFLTPVAATELQTEHGTKWMLEYIAAHKGEEEATVEIEEATEAAAPRVAPPRAGGAA